MTMHDSTMLRILPSLLFALLLLTSMPAHASPQRFKPMPENPADKVYDEQTLQPAKIADCLRREQSLLKRVRDMKKEEQQLTQQASRVQQMGEKLKALETRLNPDDAVAMDDFRFRVDVYRHAEQQYNEHATAFNQRLSALKTDQHHYNSKCADKQYYEDDYNQVLASFKPGKAATMQKPSATAASLSATSGIYLQLGAFRQQLSVEKLLQRLAGEPLTLKQHQNNKGLIIVRAGPFDDMAEAERIRQHLVERYAIKAFVQKP